MPQTEQRETLDAIPASFAPGTIIAGKYRIERELAAGGVGVVALATHIELGQRVAIKYLRSELRADRSVAERFKREGRLAASLRSDHVVRVYDVGALENGAPYIVMEYLEGEDLSEVLRGGPVSIDVAVQWTLQACHALAEAHSHGIVHRDLKPANLFLASRGSAPPIVKILDFGISKVAANSALKWSGTATHQNESFGTPLYMSPEQLVSSANVDARSDIWSVGVVLYELLTGRMPFEGTDLLQIVADIIASVPQPIRDRRPEIPIELAQIVHSCLTYDPAKRPADVTELVRSLQPFASGEHVRQISLGETALELSGVHSLAWAPESLPEKPKLALFGAIGGVSLLAGAALVVVTALLRATPAPAPAFATARELPNVIEKQVASAEPIIELFEIPVEVDAGAPIVLRRAPPVARPARSSAEHEEFGDRR